jgi:hypothetical protein
MNLGTVRVEERASIGSEAFVLYDEPSRRLTTP